MTTPSTSKTAQSRRKKDTQLEDENDWENHWLLRVPADYAERVRKFCEMETPQEKLRIKFNQDQRHGTLSIGQNTLHFTVYDLPCIIEVMKTIDKVNLFKVNNLSQMLLCTEEPQPIPVIQSPQHPSTSAEMKTIEEVEAAAAEAQLIKQKREKMYQYPHGMLPPLKNVRKKRFRKTKKKKYMDAPEVEKEVKRLLRDDLSAVRTWYEIVTVEDGKSTTQEVPKKAKPQVQPTQQDIFEAAQRDLFEEAQDELGDLPDLSDQMDNSQPQKNLHDLFGEISSSEGEDDDDME